MRRITTIAFFIVFMSSIAAYANPGDIIWSHTYGGCSSDHGECVQRTNDGGYIVVGYTYSFGSGGSDIYLIKTDAEGDTMWSKTYGGSDYDEAFYVQQTNDSGFIVAGYYGYNGVPGSHDGYLIKTDANGDTLWSHMYGDSTGGDWLSSVQQTDDGGYIALGSTQSFGAGDWDVYLIKTDANGDTIWTKTYGGVNLDQGYFLQQTDDGGYIIVGFTDPGAGKYDVYLIKTDNNGDTLWTKTYGGSEVDEGSWVERTYDGGYIIAASTNSFGEGGFDFYLIKTDADGDTVWTREYGGSGDDMALSVKQTNDGGYALIGGTASFGGGNDVYLVKTDADGDTVWTQNYGGDNGANEYGTSVLQAADGSLVFSGDASLDVWLVKVESGLDDVSDDNEIPIEYNSVNNYPNPFNSSTTIEYNLTKKQNVKLEIYNLLGQRITTLIDSYQQAGRHGVIWDAKGYPGGIYFYKLTAGNTVFTKRMTLLK